MSTKQQSQRPRDQNGLGDTGTVSIRAALRPCQHTCSAFRRDAMRGLGALGCVADAIALICYREELLVVRLRGASSRSSLSIRARKDSTSFCVE
jgi:hypothetical protein